MKSEGRVEAAPHRGVSWAVIAVLAMGAVIVGHAAGYWLAHPDVHARSAVLDSSGHSYWQTAVGLALIGAIVAGIGQALVGASNRRSRRQFGVHRAWARLAALQVLTFVLLEVLERVAAGVPMANLLDEPAFWLALPIQVLVAAAAAVYLALAERTGASLSSGDFAVPLSGWVQPIAAPGAFFLDRRFAGGLRSRSPPALLPVN